MFSLSRVDTTGKDIRTTLGDIGFGIAALIEASITKEKQEDQEQILTRYVNGEERFISLRHTQVSADDGILDLIHIRDITDQRRAIITFAEQKALNDSYTRVQMILKFLPDPTYVIDNNGHILFWNPAIEELSGLKSEEITKKFRLKELHDIAEFGGHSLINLALHPELPWEGLFPYIERSGDAIRTSYWAEIRGRNRYLSVIAARLYDENGQVAGAIETIRDITSHKVNEEALLVSNRKLNLLSSITRHDIQNKVMIAKSHVFLMKESALSDEQVKSIDAIDRSMVAIEHFIAFTRTYQELGLRASTWQDVRKTFELAVEEVGSGEVVIHNSLQGISVLADSLFGKVCYNLIENAIRHGKNLTKIEIDSQETGTGLKIIVADDGGGVPDDLKETIFERGYGKNTGFGLFLAREILSISEITITEQGQYGTGCRFVLDVPQGKFRKE
jgi:PAS domain S-box-containing protein